MTTPDEGGVPQSRRDPLPLVSEGFLLVDKPRGPSSHQVTAWVRDMLRLPRAGHAGTLDPNVSGVLWVGFGAALKLIPLVLEFPKRYLALITLHAEATRPSLEGLLKDFEGPIFQTPPVRSAVRRERRIRRLHHLTLLEQDGPDVLVDVTADSGTYIRTLAVDLGEALGVGAHLAELRRLATGPFREEAAISLSDLSDAVVRADEGAPEDLARFVHPAAEVWGQFPQVVLRDGAASAITHGASLASGGIAKVVGSFSAGAHVVMVDRRGKLVAFGRATVDSAPLPRPRSGWVVQTERVLGNPAEYPPRWGRLPRATGTDAGSSGSTDSGGVDRPRHGVVARLGG